MLKLKDLLRKSVNSNNKQVNFSLRKKQLDKYGVNVEAILDMEIKKDVDFLK